MPPTFVQGLDLAPQATRQTRGRNDVNEPATLMFGTVLKSLASGMHDELTDPQQSKHQHVDADDGSVTQVEDGQELLQDLTSSLPLTQPIAAPEARQQLHRDVHSAGYGHLAHAKITDWRPEQMISHCMQVNPDGDEYTLGSTIGTAYKVLPRSDKGVEGNANAHLVIEKLSTLVSPDLRHGELRSDDDVLAGLPGSSSDSDRLSATQSLPTIKPTDYPLTSVPVGLSPARQLLSIIESHLKPQLASPHFAKDTRVQSEEVRVLRMTLRPVDLGEIEVTLRRRGAEMQIRIVVSKQAAADTLQGDLSFLNGRIATLLPEDGTHSVAIFMSSSDSTASSGLQSHFRSENEVIFNGQGGLPSGGGQRPSPRKEDEQSIVESEHYDKDTPPQLGASGIIV